MPPFRLTKAARADLREIGRYTRNMWGREQAVRYLGGPDACFCQLADDPGAGKVHPDVPPGRRLLHGRHAVFYRVDEAGALLVVRVRHARMVPELHLSSGESSAFPCVTGAPLHAPAQRTAPRTRSKAGATTGSTLPPTWRPKRLPSVTT